MKNGKTKTPEKKQSPRLTIRFTKPTVLTELESLAQAADRKVSDYARVVLSEHIKASKAGAK